MNHTRDQEIVEGLKRGELLAKLKCGCVIIQDRTADAYIVYCPLHKATPEMYGACKELIERNRLGYSIKLDTIKQALAKAEGGKGNDWYDFKNLSHTLHGI